MKVVAGQYIKKQCDRFLNDLARDDLYWDFEWMNKVHTFFDKILVVPELGNSVEMPEAHAFWIEQIHCLRYKSNKVRKYTTAYIQVARKNFKTYYAAGNALFELILGADNMPSIMCGANSRDQAIICTEMCGRLMSVSPMLKKLIEAKSVEVFTYRKKTTEISLEIGSRIGRLEAMPRDPGDGGNPAVAIIDEFHEAKDMSLLETMKSGQAQRREPLNMIITSPGTNKEVPCYSVLRKTSIDILNGLVEDDRFLPVIFELDSDEEWDDIEMLVKSNPMMYVTETLKPYLVSRIKEAKNQGGFVESSVKIKNSGIWTDVADVWIPDAILKSNSFNISDDRLIGRECFIGLDLAKKEDLNACALFFPNIDGKNVVKMMYWIPEDKVRDNRDRIDYSRHVQNGWMIQQDGNVSDHRLVSNDIIAELKKYSIRSFGYDARYAYGAIIPDLVSAGYEEVLHPVGQGFELSPAVVWANESIRRLEFDLKDNPVLLWNFANTVMKMGHHGDMYPSKAESNNRIDGVSALLTAITEFLHVGVAKQTYTGFAVLN